MRTVFGFVALAGIVTIILGVISGLREGSAARQVVNAPPTAEEQQTAQLQAERRIESDRIARCMGPNATSLPPKVFSKMMDACERGAPGTPESNPIAAAEAYQKAIDEEQRLVIAAQEKDQARQAPETIGGGSAPSPQPQDQQP